MIERFAAQLVEVEAGTALKVRSAEAKIGLDRGKIAASKVGVWGLASDHKRLIYRQEVVLGRGIRFALFVG